MLATLKAHYSHQMMHPGLLGLLVNPFYFARRGLLLAVFYVVVKSVLTIIVQVTTMDAMTASMQASIRSQSKNNADAGAEVMGTAMQIGVYIGIAFVVVWGLIQLCFYLWSWTYLRKDTVLKHFCLTSETVS